MIEIKRDIWKTDSMSTEEREFYQRLEESSEDINKAYLSRSIRESRIQAADFYRDCYYKKLCPLTSIVCIKESEPDFDNGLTGIKIAQPPKISYSIPVITAEPIPIYNFDLKVKMKNKLVLALEFNDEFSVMCGAGDYSEKLKEYLVENSENKLDWDTQEGIAKEMEVILQKEMRSCEEFTDGNSIILGYFADESQEKFITIISVMSTGCIVTNYKNYSITTSTSTWRK